MRPDAAGVPDAEQVERILPEHLVPGTLSIVVFGPGRGEAIVVVLPDGTVGVVDGCREPTDPSTGQGDPVRMLLNELEARARDRGETFRIGFVCLTHPHDDHYGGLGHLLDSYQGRIDNVWSIFESGTRYAGPLMKYVEATRAGGDALPDIKDVRGLERFLHGLSRAIEPDATEFKFLLKDRPLLTQKPGEGPPVVVLGCAPVDRDVARAHDELVRALKVLARNEKLSTSFDPNVTSGVLLIKWGKAGVLLGGDLIRRKGSYLGWDGAEKAISEEVQVIKVAHHASAEAHHEELWGRLKARLAIVTPFKGAAGEMPPRPS